MNNAVDNLIAKMQGMEFDGQRQTLINFIRSAKEDSIERHREYLTRLKAIHKQGETKRFKNEFKVVFNQLLNLSSSNKKTMKNREYRKTYINKLEENGRSKR